MLILTSIKDDGLFKVANVEVRSIGVASCTSS